MTPGLAMVAPHGLSHPTHATVRSTRCPVAAETPNGTELDGFFHAEQEKNLKQEKQTPSSQPPLPLGRSQRTSRHHFLPCFAPGEPFCPKPASLIPADVLP